MFLRSSTFLSACLLLGLLASGCATKPPAPAQHVFFPSPPDEPRIQYLWSFGAESDLGGRSSLEEFVVGSEGIHRPIVKPYGVAIAKGKIYVCDTQAGNVSVSDLARRKLRYLKPQGQAALKVPVGVAVDEEERVYITDTGRNQVLVLSPQGEMVGLIGQTGEMRPCGITVTKDRIYVTDLANHCVRVYAKASRELQFTFPKPDSAEAERLFQPTNIAIDGKGRVCISDSGGFAVKIFDQEGKYVQTIGELGVTPGRFAMPKGIAADREGRIYVVDAAAPVIQLFDDQGRLLMYFGQPSTSGPAGLYLPAGLAIDYSSVSAFEKYVAPGYKLDYIILVTNQIGPRKVGVYGFLRKS